MRTTRKAIIKILNQIPSLSLDASKSLSSRGDNIPKKNTFKSNSIGPQPPRRVISTPRDQEEVYNRLRMFDPLNLPQVEAYARSTFRDIIDDHKLTTYDQNANSIIPISNPQDPMEMANNKRLARLGLFGVGNSSPNKFLGDTPVGAALNLLFPKTSSAHSIGFNEAYINAMGNQHLRPEFEYMRQYMKPTFKNVLGALWEQQKLRRAPLEEFHKLGEQHIKNLVNNGLVKNYGAGAINRIDQGLNRISVRYLDPESEGSLLGPTVQGAYLPSSHEIVIPEFKFKKESTLERLDTLSHELAHASRFDIYSYLNNLNKLPKQYVNNTIAREIRDVDGNVIPYRMDSFGNGVLFNFHNTPSITLGHPNNHIGMSGINNEMVTDEYLNRPLTIPTGEMDSDIDGLDHLNYTAISKSSYDKSPKEIGARNSETMNLGYFLPGNLPNRLRANTMLHQTQTPGHFEGVNYSNDPKDVESVGMYTFSRIFPFLNRPFRPHHRRFDLFLYNKGGKIKHA